MFKKLIVSLLILLPTTLMAHGLPSKSGSDFKNKVSDNPRPQTNKNDDKEGLPFYELEFNYGGHLKASFTFEKRPFVMEEVIMYIQFKDAKTLQPVALKNPPDISLFMPQIDMQHGSLPTVVESQVDEFGQILPGEYKVSNMYFIMGGAWDVQVNIGGFIFGDNQKFIIEFDPESGGCISHTAK